MARLITLLFLFSNALAMSHGPIHEKIEHVSKEIEKDKLNPDLYILRSSYYKIDGNFDKSLADLIFAEQLAPNKSTIKFLLAELHYDFGFYHAALANINIYLNQSSSLGQTYLLKCKIFNRLLEADSALIYIEKAFEHYDKPTTRLYIFAKEMALSQNKEDFHRAESWIVKGRTELKGDLVLAEEHVRLAMQFSKYELAENLCKEVLPSLKRKEAWQFLLAQIYSQDQRKDLALLTLNECQQSIDALPKRIRATLHIKGLQHQLNQLKQDLSPN